MSNTHPLLEPISQTLNYGDLPETWRVPEIERFSSDKTLYDYQTDALKNAARALYYYYGKGENDWQPTEPENTDDRRKRDFAGRYDSHIDGFTVSKYETEAKRRHLEENPVFRILSEFISPQGEEIPYRQLINRMCFWMATGSGKTLVMIKLIEYLVRLRERREIPPHNILILAPGDHLIGQIQRTVEEFNRFGLSINMVPLRNVGKAHQIRLDDHATVYYHRGDNVSDVRKEALIDYREYQHAGKWYVLLDEAHKGGKEDSKRQAYYAVLARRGFLFNFSATFTDPEDIVTTVKKYNLEEFITKGHGKNIYLNEKELDAFRNRNAEINHNERKKIVLKSLITLACVSLRVAALRRDTGLENLYHLPLMLTLVNSVNTDVENERNDLWAFFQTLREIAAGEIDDSLFERSKTELIADWDDARLLFKGDGGGIIGIDHAFTQGMTLANLRKAIFLSEAQGALQLIRSSDNKELAFQMKNAAAPFALIRIGDTSKWRNQLLVGYEETTALREHSFFDGLEQSSITILMGSRSFFESWDSNRPNVINFINIGGTEARKFVVQSVGRGVRIETLPGRRHRLASLPDSKEKTALQPYQDEVRLPETLFLFATNRAAVKSVLEGLRTEKSGVFEHIEGFEKSKRPRIEGKEMMLLVPVYKDGDRDAPDTAHNRAKFAISDNTLHRLNGWLENTSDAVLAVRDNLSHRQIKTLREMARGRGVQSSTEKEYASLSFLQSCLLSHLSKTGKAADTVRELDEDRDIVHFRRISVQLDEENIAALRGKIASVIKGTVSEEEKRNMAGRYSQGEVDEKELQEYMSRKSEGSFKGLKIKNVAEHYYRPVIMRKQGKADFIKHIIGTESEVKFIEDLETWLENNDKPQWDAWMFSKIDESLDEVHIPYYDGSVNEYRRFLPDFIFWMREGREYRIVFVDPKGTEHASSSRKIDGYRQLFEDGDDTHRAFDYRGLRVSVHLVMFNKKPSSAPALYRRFWTQDPADIFGQPVNCHPEHAI